MRKFTSIYFFLLSIWSLFGQHNEHYEVRGVWLTTNYQLDWPSKTGTSERIVLQQKAELCRMLDKIEAANMNVVFFQARLRGEVLFESTLEPWTSFVSGKRGVSPGFDPLAFAIEECHKRGLQCHAWMICMPLGSSAHFKQRVFQGPLNKDLDWITHHRGEAFLEPSHPKVADYLAQLAAEITAQYDVDGIHLDYIRYPDVMTGYPDAALYKRSGSGLKLADWRRENINQVVYAVYDAVKELKPWVKVSSSPLGRFIDLPGMRHYGWNAFNSVYQDAQRWMKDEKHDLVVPMMYYKDHLFFPYLANWVQNSNNRPIVTGLGAYRLETTEANWDIDVMENQVKVGRRMGAGGQAVYRAENFSKNTKGLAELLVDHLYLTPAVYPPMIWVDADSLDAPDNLSFSSEAAGTRIQWDPVSGGYAYNLYGYFRNAMGEEVKEVIAASLRKTEYFSSKPHLKSRYHTFEVRSSNRFHHESASASITPVKGRGSKLTPDFYEISYDKEQNSVILPANKRYVELLVKGISGSVLQQTRLDDNNVILSEQVIVPLDVALNSGFFSIELLDRNGLKVNRFITVD